ncbi:sugar phosphate isomerase/epimerase [Pirellulales bacterium]|nr:sugar phosphate isomerase/epimerase [Pirellulales bacterium]
MKFGINTLLFAFPFTNDSTKQFDRFREWGFDSVELAVADAGDIDAAHVKRELDRTGLKCSAFCALMGPDRDLRGNDAQQKTAAEYVESMLDLMAVVGCPKLVGPLYSAVGRTEGYSDDEKAAQWKCVADHLGRLADAAQSKGQQLCLEPLNRFETDMINTADQGLRMLDDVGHPALTLHLDTFHMNIEEKCSADAIRRAGDRLGHLHACGSDRGTPGKDHIDWGPIVEALRDVGYDGDAVIESFTVDVTMIARAAAIWRRIEPTRDEIAVDGLKFLKGAFGS